MDICFFTHYLPNPYIGGVERVTYNLTQYFKENGINVYFLTTGGKHHSGLIPTEYNLDKRAAFINEFLKKNNIRILIDQYISEPYLRHPHIDSTIKIIGCHHIDIIERHIFRSLLQTFSINNLKSSLMNVAFLLNTPRRRFYNNRKISNLLTGGIDRLIYLSKHYVNHMQKKHPKNKSLFSAIPNACENQLSSLSPINCKKKQIVWCGRIVHNPKNVLFLIKLWRNLSTEFTDWEMILVGDGCDRHLLEDKIKRYRLNRITITGYTDPYPYYRDARIFVFPSFSEGFGMSLIESMAHSYVPVVFDTSMVFHDIIEHGTNGFIIPDYNESEFIDTCRKLMNSDLSSYAENARKSISQFSIDTVGKQWLTLFNEIIA